MKNNKEAKISFWARHLTTVVSVTLVLLLMGLIAIVWIGADNETRRIRERVEISVAMNDSVAPALTKQLAGKIAKQPYALSVRVISKEEALKNWTVDTGEDLMELFGVNPLSEEISFTLQADYTSTAAIGKIRTTLAKETGVASVSVPDDSMIESMNRNISRLSLILMIVAAIMLFITFVLINNTVHLTIYSRRFTIHTMKLVGATNGFIRRPIIWSNVLAGLISAAAAAAILAGAIYGSKEGGVIDLAAYVGWCNIALVAAGMALVGMLLCGLAALVSANSYLRKDYDALFNS